MTLKQYDDLKKWASSNCLTVIPDSRVYNEIEEIKIEIPSDLNDFEEWYKPQLMPKIKAMAGDYISFTTSSSRAGSFPCLSFVVNPVG